MYGTTTTKIHGLSPGGLVLTRNFITREVLQLLTDGQISALRVPGFYPKDLCDRLADWIIQAPSRANYGHDTATNSRHVEYHDYGVDRVGIPRNSLIGKDSDSAEWDEYFKQGQMVTQLIEELTGNYSSD